MRFLLTQSALAKYCWENPVTLLVFEGRNAVESTQKILGYVDLTKLMQSTKINKDSIICECSPTAKEAGR